MKLLQNGKADLATIILAHGAGAGMEHPFMESFATGLANRGMKVIRFNFPYMQKTIEDGKKRPPDRAPKLLEAYEAVIKEATRNDQPLIIGGKSMGGRIASMLAASSETPIDGLVCLGYPFHAPGKPEKVRTDHFPDIKVPTLIVQGERDPFGGTALIDTMSFPANFEIHVAPDGNHDLTPRKKSGHTQEENWDKAMDAIARLAKTLQ